MEDSFLGDDVGPRRTRRPSRGHYKRRSEKSQSPFPLFDDRGARESYVDSRRRIGNEFGEDDRAIRLVCYDDNVTVRWAVPL